MPDQLRVGHVLGNDNGDDSGTRYSGYCGGEFGRDSYDLKRVEVIGADWVVVRDTHGRPDFYAGDPNDLVRYILPSAAWDEF